MTEATLVASRDVLKRNLSITRTGINREVGKIVQILRWGRARGLCRGSAEELRERMEPEAVLRIDLLLLRRDGCCHGLGAEDLGSDLVLLSRGQRRGFLDPSIRANILSSSMLS